MDNPFVIQLNETREALLSTLIEYREVMPISLIEIGKAALAMPGKVAAYSAPITDDTTAEGTRLPKWPLYVLVSYAAACRTSDERAGWRVALPSAVAVEIAMAAADLLDEIADDDPSYIVERYGPGQALNTANLMLVMAQQVLARAAATDTSSRNLEALDALQSMLVEAATGQHLDMLYGGLPPGDVDLDMSADITRRKAGALIGGACRIGATMSGAETEVVQAFDKLGREIGGIAQVTNDLQDVLPLDPREPNTSTTSRKTDLRLRKRTLPIVFTLRDDSPEPNELQRAFAGDSGEPVDEEGLRMAVAEAGGLDFARLVIGVHAEQMSQTLEKLEELRPGAKEILAPIVALVS